MKPLVVIRFFDTKYIEIFIATIIPNIISSLWIY